MKSRGENDHKKYAAIAAAVVAAIGLAGVVAGALHAAPSFLHMRQNLSHTDCTSAYPDLAVSPDLNYMAVTWVEGYTTTSGSRGHVYLRVASESGGFGTPIEVYNGSDNACAYDRAAVAISGTTAHVAYVVFADCTNRQNTRIYYTTCSLTNGTCGSNESVLSTTTQKIFWVDIAVDEDGNPHLVFARYEQEGPDLHGKIFYMGHTGSGWGSVETVYDQALTNNHTPAIAWSDSNGGCAHVAWEDETAGAILYRRRCAGVWDDLRTIDSSPGEPPHKPDIAATPDGRLFIVWDYLAHEHTPPTHYLVYKRSNDGGDNFYPPADPLGVGNDNTGGLDAYTDYVVGAAEETAYLKNLQPSVALNQDGWPTVAWHTGGGTGGVYYTYAISGNDTSVDWVTPTLLFEGQAGAPAVAFGGWITDTIPLLHFAYMGTTGESWNVYYDSNEAAIIDPPKIYLPLVMRGY